LIIIILLKNKQRIRKRDNNSEFAIELPSVDLLQVPGLNPGPFVRQFGMQPFDQTIVIIQFLSLEKRKSLIHCRLS